MNVNAKSATKSAGTFCQCPEWYEVRRDLRSVQNVGAKSEKLEGVEVAKWCCDAFS